MDELTINVGKVNIQGTNSVCMIGDNHNSSNYGRGNSQNRGGQRPGAKNPAFQIPKGKRRKRGYVFDPNYPGNKSMAKKYILPGNQLETDSSYESSDD